MSDGGLAWLLGAFETVLITLSDLGAENGGGNGDIDIEETLAECARYTRIDLKPGSDMTCWLLVSAY